MIMMKTKNIIEDQIRSFSRLLEVEESVTQSAIAIYDSLRSNGTIFFCGNGGSAADSQHLSAEFVGRFLQERKPLSSIALTVNTSALTAISNDYGYETVFSRQIQAIGQPGDVLIGMSTSGNSLNIVNAIATANAIGIKTIAMTGSAKSSMSEIADMSIAVPSNSTPRIQEMHIAIGHTICELVENEFLV